MLVIQSEISVVHRDDLDTDCELLWVARDHHVFIQYPKVPSVVHLAQVPSHLTNSTTLDSLFLTHDLSSCVVTSIFQAEKLNLSLI